jgi:hypothetical protein
MKRFKSIFMNLNRKFLQEKVSLRPTEHLFGLIRAENIIYTAYKKDLNARLAKEYLRTRDTLLNFYITKVYRNYTTTQSSAFTKLVSSITNPSGLSKFSFYVKSKANTLQNENPNSPNPSPIDTADPINPLDPPNSLTSKISNLFKKIIGSKAAEDIESTAQSILQGADANEIRRAIKIRDKKAMGSRLKAAKQRYDMMMLKYMKFYKESLQGIVEGQREVMGSDEFVFEDGSSVGERKGKFERWVKGRIPKYMQDVKFGGGGMFDRAIDKMSGDDGKKSEGSEEREKREKSEGGDKKGPSGGD